MEGLKRSPFFFYMHYHIQQILFTLGPGERLECPDCHRTQEKGKDWVMKRVYDRGCGSYECQWCGEEWRLSFVHLSNQWYLTRIL
jgi:hypothetical protein